MHLITTTSEMLAFSRSLRDEGRSIGLVPTMGALHEGHVSLIRRAKSQCDTVIVSIFVNPTQFTGGADLARYPRDLDRDIVLLTPFKLDAVFAPTATEMYPQGFDTFVEPGEISRSLEGESRPGHFRGVATIVLKLFNLVDPDLAYFGQKDFQQVLVIRRLAEDFNLRLRLVICPIVREPDGLAKSSRNVYLQGKDREAATILHRSLRKAEDLVHSGKDDSSVLLEAMRQVLAAESRAQLDYAAIVDPIGLHPIERVQPGSVALVAARVGSVRLIDNLILGPPGVDADKLLELASRARSASTPAILPEPL